MNNISAERSHGNHLEVSFTFKPKNGSKAGHPSNKANSHIEPGNMPRVSRLMALAIHFDDLVGRSEVKDYADLARLGYVTRARITQIMNLLNLAPDIQEAILFLPRTLHGRDQIREKDIRPIAVAPHWSRQRKMWKKLSSAMKI